MYPNLAAPGSSVGILLDSMHLANAKEKKNHTSPLFALLMDSLWSLYPLRHPQLANAKKISSKLEGVDSRGSLCWHGRVCPPVLKSQG